MPVDTAFFRAQAKNILGPDAAKAAVAQEVFYGLNAKLDDARLAKRAARVGVRPKDYGVSYVDGLIERFAPVFKKTGFPVDFNRWKQGVYPVEMNDGKAFNGNGFTYGEMIELAALHGGFKVKKTDLEAFWDDVATPVLKVIKTIAPYASLIPGIGTAVAIALSAGSSIALGEDIADSVIAGAVAAIPGGPEAQMAYKTAVQVGYGVARGKDVGDAALGELKSLVPEDAPEDVKKAAQAGVEIARAKALQDLGFKELAPFVPGATDREREENFLRAVDDAPKRGVTTADLFTAPLEKRLKSMTADQHQYMQVMASALASRNDLSTVTPEEIRDVVGPSPSDDAIFGALLWARTFPDKDPSREWSKVRKALFKKALDPKVRSDAAIQMMFEKDRATLVTSDGSMSTAFVGVAVLGGVIGYLWWRKH